MAAFLSDPPRLRIGPDVSLDAADVEAAARTSATTIEQSAAARDAVDRAHAALRTLEANGHTIYGVTTGFGPLVTYPSAEGDVASGDAAAQDASRPTHAEGLLAHLSTGTGACMDPVAARAMLIARLQALVQGHSGIATDVLDAYARLLPDGLTPAVPIIGSVGASGDLTPLAHAARVLTGTGRVLRDDGTVVSARDALRAVGRVPLDLSNRDALALVNGTSFMTAYAALAVARTARLLAHAERLTGWIYRLLGCTRQALDPRLHAVRGHAGQHASAAAIRDEAGPRSADAPDRPLQEVYSLRCAPQVLGAVRDQTDYVRRVVEAELNGVNDNPVLDPDTPAALHGGNFQGQQVAFAADALNAALTQMGVLAERQIDVLLTPAQNDDAPPLLAWTPGATSGLAGAQLTATALVAELRHDAQASATSSIPTNGDNQDIVSMGALAARTAYTQTERLAGILAVLGLALSQLTHLRQHNRAPGAAPDPPDWMPAVDPIIHDRPLRAEIATLSDTWLHPS